MARIKMTAAGMAKAMQDLERVWTAEIIDAEAQTITDAKAIAVQLSSGPHSTAALARAGHPYAKRAPNGLYEPFIINEQTGKFKGGWRIVVPRVTGRIVHTRLVNDSDRAKWMNGTNKMVRRTIATEIKRRIAAVRKKRLTQAKRNALRKVFKLP